MIALIPPVQRYGAHLEAFNYLSDLCSASTHELRAHSRYVLYAEHGARDWGCSGPCHGTTLAQKVTEETGPPSLSMTEGWMGMVVSTQGVLWDHNEGLPALLEQVRPELYHGSRLDIPDRKKMYFRLKGRQEQSTQPQASTWSSEYLPGKHNPYWIAYLTACTAGIWATRCRIEEKRKSYDSPTGGKSLGVLATRICEGSFVEMSSASQ